MCSSVQVVADLLANRIDKFARLVLDIEQGAGEPHVYRIQSSLPEVKRADSVAVSAADQSRMN